MGDVLLRHRQDDPEQLALSSKPAIPRIPTLWAAANGSLMRLAPVAIRCFADTADKRSGGRRSPAAPPIGAARPTDACKVMGAMISTLLQGGDWASVTDPDFFTWGELRRDRRGRGGILAVQD